MAGPEPAKPSQPPIRSFAFLPHLCQALRSDPDSIVDVDPFFTLPGYLRLDGGIIKDKREKDADPPGLQDLVDEFLSKDEEKVQKKKKSAAESLSNLRFALVDMTENILLPKFAGHRETEQGGLGSMAKTGVMLAAFQLKFDLEMLAKRHSLGTAEELFAAARALWAQSQIQSDTPIIKELHADNRKLELVDKLVRASGEAFPIPLPKNADAPKLEKIFDVVQNGSGVKLEFKGSDLVQVGKAGAPDTNKSIEDYVHAGGSSLKEVEKLTFAERMMLMLDESDNPASHTCITDIGFCYIGSCLWQYGIYDPNRGGGIWEGGSHLNLNWHKSFVPQPNPKTRSEPDFQNSTAVSAVTLFTLMGQRQLVTEEASLAMRGLTSKMKSGLTIRNPQTGQSFPVTSYTRSFFFESLPFPVSVVCSKLGIGNFNNDVILVARRDRGKILRYAAAGFDEPLHFNGKLLHELILELDKCIQQNNGLDPLDAPPANP